MQRSPGLPPVPGPAAAAPGMPPAAGVPPAAGAAAAAASAAAPAAPKPAAPEGERLVLLSCGQGAFYAHRFHAAVPAGFHCCPGPPATPANSMPAHSLPACLQSGGRRACWCPWTPQCSTLWSPTLSTATTTRAQTSRWVAGRVGGGGGGGGGGGWVVACWAESGGTPAAPAQPVVCRCRRCLLLCPHIDSCGCLPRGVSLRRRSSTCPARRRLWRAGPTACSRWWATLQAAGCPAGSVNVAGRAAWMLSRLTVS